MKILYRLPLGVICMVAFVALNIFHGLIHGTPLDGGSMDMFFMQANTFLAANANTGSLAFWRS